MNKPATFFLIIITAVLISGCYGIIHDQFTYTISQEYYTRFKFEQFGITGFGNERVAVAVVGWMATWWVGLLSGVILAIITIQRSHGQKLFKYALRGQLLMLGITFIAGLLGLFFGLIYYSVSLPQDYDTWYPNQLEEPTAFAAVGMMHNFGYAGAVFGLILAILYISKQKAPQTTNYSY